VRIRTFSLLIIAIALPMHVKSHEEQPDSAWLTCAENALERILEEEGVSASWTLIDSLPDDEVARVRSYPEVPIHDAFDATQSTAYFYDASKIVYVVQRGGVGDFVRTYGPIKLECCN
jgi:hypothetical protein